MVHSSSSYSIRKCSVIHTESLEVESGSKDEIQKRLLYLVNIRQFFLTVGLPSK